MCVWTPVPLWSMCVSFRLWSLVFGRSLMVSCGSSRSNKSAENSPKRYPWGPEEEKLFPLTLLCKTKSKSMMAIELFNWRFGKQLSELRPLLLNPNSQFSSYSAKSYKASLPRKLLRPINIKVAKTLLRHTSQCSHDLLYICVSGINSNVQDKIHAEAQNQSSSSNSANAWNSQNRVGWLKLAPRKHKQQWENAAELLLMLLMMIPEL